MKITLIGGGNMGEAVLAAIIEQRITLSSKITVCDTFEERLSYLCDEYGVATTTDCVQAAKDADAVILAVKPQNFNELATIISDRLAPSQLVISIIVGKSLKTLRANLKHDTIIRSMPNTPAQIGRGITVWTAVDTVSEEQKTLAASIFRAMGSEIYTKDERQLDMATAISGSGPAYFFYFTEALTEAALELGFNAETAKRLALETALGAAEYAARSDKELLELRKMVTSPGGTTAAAIKTLDDAAFKETVSRAVKAAYKRAIELGD